ncbi:MAG: transcriptional regulator [Burkholderiales bacterium]|nr:transcriptional regulator [Burkholderiales bacterium]
MNIKPIRTKRDFDAALKVVEGLMQAKAGSQDGDRLDILVTLIQAYEAKHYPMLPPDPVEAIKFVMEQRGLTVQDLLPVFGRANRAYEVLNRKRPLSLAMIRKLHTGLGIPAEVLIAA